MMHQKDQMTQGLAKWITVKEATTLPAYEKGNPWSKGLPIEMQRMPLRDRRGVALFYKTFSVSGVVSATVDATALGVFDLWCNGRRVGAIQDDGTEVFDELKPGWTDYRKRVLYYSYDLTPYLKEGENTLLAAVAPGWYNGRISFATYGMNNHVSFMASIKLCDETGTHTLTTDSAWQAGWGSAVRSSDIWDGEWYDASYPGFAALSVQPEGIAWTDATEESYDIEVTPQVGPAIRVRAGLTRTPETVTVYDGIEYNGSDYGKIHVIRREEGINAFSLRKGETAVLDLGQNMVGWPAFTVKGSKGTAVNIRVAEMLNDSGLISRGNDNAEGAIYTINYRSAKAKLKYILGESDRLESYHPHFTFYGFRYLEVKADGDVEFSNFSCPVVGSDIRETATMSTSNADVNRLLSNIIWGQRGNYLSVPTDCPQRDERLGWTGDTQAFCGTASYNGDVKGFFHKWLQDARDSQTEEGMYPDVIPAMDSVGYGGSAWGDAGVIVPYIIWKMYADTSIISEHYDSMEKYMGWLATTNCDGPRATYGDWLAYEPTDRRFISVAYYALDAMYMELMSRAIGKEDRAAHYREVYEQVRNSFRSRYCDENGDLRADYRTQTGYLLALRIDLLDPERRADAVQALKQKIVDNGYRLSTGFVGSCILCEVLAEFGENNLAYSLLLQTENPSWLYSVYQGATTIWERWNSYTKDKGFGDVGMNSFNHYAYGAVQEWMFRHVAGIETTVWAPGFARPVLQPKPDTRTPEEIPAGQERMTWVKASFESASGKIISEWDTTKGFVYRVEVPVESDLYLPILTDQPTFLQNGEVHRFADYQQTPCKKAVKLVLQAGAYTFEQN